MTDALADQIEAACVEAEDDLDTGADHYDEPVVTVKALRKILETKEAHDA